MNSVTKNFFLASLVYLGLSLFMQAITVFDLWLGFNPISYTTAISITHIFLVGWLTQLALALIYDQWLDGVSQKRGTWVFLLFNIGLPLVLVGQPGLLIFGGVWLGAAASLGRLVLARRAPPLEVLQTRTHAVRHAQRESASHRCRRRIRSRSSRA